MGEVYVYDKWTEDFSTTGLCGVLTPFSCRHEEIAGGMSAVTLEHPFDDLGRWKHIQRGNVLKCLCRVRTTPEILNGQVVTAVEVWTVLDTATKAQRGVYTKAEKGRRKATLKPGVQVTVVQKGTSRYKIKSGKVTGWIAQEALSFTLAETLDGATDAIEESAPPWIVRYQLFRIQSVDIDTQAGTVTAYAPHISYDLMGNITRVDYPYPLTAQMALDGCPEDCAQDHQHLQGGILGNCDFAHEFEAYTDIGDSRTSAQWVNVNPIEALLDPENGFCARWGAELVRDDFELYFLRRAGRNRGTRIEYAKNLLGVNMTVSDEQAATVVLPIGEKKDGSELYLTDQEPGQIAQGPGGLAQIGQIIELEDDQGAVSARVAGNYVISPHADDYPAARGYVLRCDDCAVEKGKKGVTVEIARGRMLRQAKALFDQEQIDLPGVTLTVNFLQLGDTQEYAQYKDLEPVYLYDQVPVVDRVHGIEVIADVHRVAWDCLLERMEEVELGNVREGGQAIYSWQLAGIDGGKLQPDTVPGAALEEGAVPENKLDPDLQAALNQAWENIESARELLLGTEAWLDAVQAQTEPILQAVKDEQGNITALQLTATDIRAGLRDAQQNLAAVELTAQQLQTALTNAQGDISTLIQRADGFSTSIANLNGEISSVQQTAGSLSSTVAILDGQVQSLIQQTAAGVAIKLQNTVNGNAMLATFGSDPNGYGLVGLSISRNGSGGGGMYPSSGDLWVMGPSGLALVGGGAIIHLRTFGVSDEEDGTIRNYAQCGCHLVPDGESAGQVSLGTRGSFGAYRWKNVNITGSVNNSSDARLKRCIEDLDVEELLETLRPRRFKLRQDGAKAKWRWGFVAQEAQEALETLDGEPVEFYDGEDPEHLSLCYMELIAPLVAGYQAQQARIGRLEARLSRLEGKSYAEPGP